jgi:curli biogenesis system outer membrane secretion channel CsgG
MKMYKMFTMLVALICCGCVFNALAQESTKSSVSATFTVTVEPATATVTAPVAENVVETAPAEQPQRKWKIGDDPNLRPRLAVCTFQVRNSGSYTMIAGTKVGTHYLVEKLAEALNDSLSQSRKFTMLDRAYNGDVQTELRRLNFDSADKSDLVKLGKLLATDYLLVGTAEVMEPVKPQTNPYSGVTTYPQATFMEVHYRLLVVSTGQIALSNTIDLQTDEISGRTVDEYISASLVRAATKISDEILESVMPMEIVGTAGNEVIVGQGGKTVGVGEIFEVYAQGEELFDSRTGESLGRTDTPVGRVQVVRVMPKISYCRILNCTQTLTKGMTVRRSANDGSAQGTYEEAPSTRINISPSGGYVAPF